jgi:asparagine synthetase B (glutamine-hydrolysing)
MEAAGLDLNPEQESYPEFCVYRYVMSARSLYKGIGKLMKGQILGIDLESGHTTSAYKWDMKIEKRINSSEMPEIVKMIENALSSSIENTYSSVKRMGILLSGGIDSALLAAACKKRDMDFDSFSSSFVFINKDDREDEYALSVAKHLGLNHTIISSTPEQYLTDLVWAIHAAEEPVHHLQSVMLYRLFKESAKSGYDLFLCGEGADGLFGNDAHMKYFKYRTRIDLGCVTGLHWLFKTAYRAMGLKNERLDYFAHDFGERFGNDNHILWTLGRYGDPEIVRQYFKSSRKDIYKSRMNLMQNYPDLGLMDKITALSLIGEGFETMTIWSKLAEKHQMEIVYPYDHPGVIGHAMEIPWAIKLREEKHIIRSLLRKYNFPEEFIMRPKLSFGFPVKFWAPKGALFQPLVDMAAEMFEPSFLQSLQSEETPKAMVLWNRRSYQK